MKEIKELDLKIGQRIEVMAEVKRYNAKVHLPTVLLIGGQRYILDMGQGRQKR